MLFAFSKGSNGNGSDRFVLYIPFTIPPGRKIDFPKKEIKKDIKGYSICLEKLTYIYSITIGPFNTIDEAYQFFPKLCSSLLWTSLKLEAGIIYPKLINEVHLENNLIPVHEDSHIVGWSSIDGHYDAEKAVVRPDAKKLIRTEMGRPTIICGISASKFVEYISEAILFKSPENIIKDKKLQLAIALYASYHYELSDNAKFITLVTVLEALKPQEEISDIAKEALASAKSVIKEKQKSYKKDSKEWRELENLASRVGGLKKQSIGAQIRNYIYGVVQENQELGDPVCVINKIKGLYDLRSNLLHEGMADNEKIKEAHQFLVGFIPKILEWLYRKEANQ